jgi:signal transduction histidine kinase/CheY-like chemotaxis protein
VEPRTRVVTPAAVAALSFAAMVAVYALLPSDPWLRSGAASVAFLWSSGFAAACCVAARRRSTDPLQRRAWLWMGLGATSFLVAQLYWSAVELGTGGPPPFPSPADIGYLGIYPCFLVAATTLLRDAPRRLAGPELRIDIGLVTLITGALAFEFLLEPLLVPMESPLVLVVSLLWSAGGIAVLWVLLVQLLGRTGFPLATAGLASLGVAVLCVTNVVYAPMAYRGSYAAGSVLDLGWNAGLLLVAGAAARARGGAAEPVAAPAAAAHALRAIALFVGVGGLAALALTAAIRAGETDLAVILAVGITVVGARLGYSLRGDRQYAALLEREVGRQTTSLLDSLAATAAAERELRVVMEAVPDAISLLDREGRVLDMNRPARDLGAPAGPLPPAGAATRSVFDGLDPVAVEIVRDNLGAAFAGEVRRFELVVTRDDRSRAVSAVLYAPVREGPRITKVLSIARDITDARRTQAQLQQAEKLAAMGQMVSGVAHEVNNPAAIISGFAQTLLLDDLKPDHQDVLRMIHDEATRIGRITGNLLAFARAGARERSLVDVNDIVRKTFALRSYHFTTLNVAVTLDLDPSDPQVWGHGGELQQLLLNLLINAEQALTSVDTARGITVRTRLGTDEVSIVCADTGPGIPTAIRHRIFDPFFTTKPEGVGTGLGLSICYGIAQDHGGRLSVESEEGHGATFTVALPRDPRSAARPHLPPATARPQAAGAVAVLLVEDEPGLRKAVARYLNRHGISVQAVAEGAAALRLLRTHDFDVILSDVRMPGMGGREFLERLRREHPDLTTRLVFTTGDTYAPDTAALLAEAGVPSIVKPFDFPRLEQLIREVVAAARARA